MFGGGSVGVVCEVTRAPVVSPGVPTVPQALGALLSQQESMALPIVRRMTCAVTHLVGHEAVVTAAVAGVPSQGLTRVISTFEKLHQYDEVG